MSKKLPYIDVTYNGEVTTYNELLSDIELRGVYGQYPNGVETKLILSHDKIQKIKISLVNDKIIRGNFVSSQVNLFELSGIDELNKVIEFLTYVRDYKGEKK
jgi:hypothetical protein